MIPPPVPHPLTPAQLQTIGAYLYEEPRYWQTRLAADLMVSPQAVRHWSGGLRAVPGPAIAALRLMVRNKSETDSLLS